MQKQVENTTVKTRSMVEASKQRSIRKTLGIKKRSGK